jgi:hypothetical protein
MIPYPYEEVSRFKVRKGHLEVLNNFDTASLIDTDCFYLCRIRHTRWLLSLSNLEITWKPPRQVRHSACYIAKMIEFTKSRASAAGPLVATTVLYHVTPACSREVFITSLLNTQLLLYHQPIACHGSLTRRKRHPLKAPPKTGPPSNPNGASALRNLYTRLCRSPYLEPSALFVRDSKLRPLGLRFHKPSPRVTANMAELTAGETSSDPVAYGVAFP